MPKPFAVFDVDGTIFKSSLVEKVIDACIADGLFARRTFDQAFSYKRKWQLHNTERTYQIYIRLLVQALVHEMQGVDKRWFDKVTNAMLAQHAVRKFGFPRQLISALSPTHEIIAISGSPEFLVRPFLATLPITYIFGSTYGVKEGRFTGEAQAVANKAEIIHGLLNQGKVLQAGSVAVGDTISDAPLMEFASYPIMFNASKTLTNYGKNRQRRWARVHEVKDQVTALIYDAGRRGYAEQSVSDLLAAVTLHSS